MSPELRLPVSASLLLASLLPWLGGGGQAAGPPLVRQMYADVTVEVRRGGAGAVVVVAADSAKAVEVRLLARDLRRWTDSASRVLAARPRSRRASARWEVVVEGPGVETGSMSLARVISPPDTTITILIAAPDFETVRVTVGAQEARTFVVAMRRAADAVLSSSRGQRGTPPPAAPRSRPPGPS